MTTFVTRLCRKEQRTILLWQETLRRLCAPDAADPLSDGPGPSRRLLSELSAAEQTAFQHRLGLTPPPELSPLPKGTRAETPSIETKRGPQQIQAWSFSGRLCVHRSIGRISGYTVSHQPCGVDQHP